jgi:hypothetical protein
MHWDERYGGEDYFYGREPNDFLREQAHRLRGPVLSICEGEGRNAVHLASLGLDVLGVDGSAAGLAKAQRLAAERGVAIRTQQADLAGFDPRPARFGAVVSIFGHMPSALRARLYPRLIEALEPGGLFLLEAYSEGQLGRGTGGPDDMDRLMNIAKIRHELGGLEPLILEEKERMVVEGQGHTGAAQVVQFLGRKPADQP